MGCAPSKNVDLTTEVSLYHFDLHRVVGKGAFGKVRHRAYISLQPSHSCVQVRVVQHKKNKKLYALKYMHKQQCIKQKAGSNIIQERRLLEEVGTTLSILHVLLLTSSM
jgi:serine/threonine kinase 32